MFGFQMPKSNSEETAIGIDLGTTNTVVAYYDKSKKKEEILVNQPGDRITPSYIGLIGNERIIGKTAKGKKNTQYLKNIIFDTKRLIGRKFTDKEVQEDMGRWTFDVIEGENERPLISANNKKYHPEQISALFLRQLVAEASTRLKKKLTKAVITVPARFNNAQRNATKDAGKIALLDVIGMINEPTAAAIAYNLDNQENENKNILVFDLGAGTFDLSLLKVVGGKIKILATDGDTHLGGRDFDKVIFDWAIKKFEEKGVSFNEQLRSYLLDQCEFAKIILSDCTNADINLDIQGVEPINLTRAIFNAKSKDLFKQIFEYTDNFLKVSKISADQLSGVIKVGGSTRIYKIKEELNDKFGSKLTEEKNPDEVVAMGAAIFAQKLIENNYKTPDFFEDITPLTIGTMVADGSLSKIVPRFKKFGSTFQRGYQTAYDFQEVCQFPIYEGENFKVASNNHFLGNLVLNDIPKKPKGEVTFLVTIKIDEKGIIETTAMEEGTQNIITVVFKNNGLLSEKELTELISEAKKEEDSASVEKAKKKIKDELTDKIGEIEIDIEDGKLSEGIESRIKDKIKRINDCIETQYDDIDEQQMRKWIRELEEMAKK